jgi:hypothetical protein
MKDYTVRRSGEDVFVTRYDRDTDRDVDVSSSDPHEVLNPSGVPIAYGMSWRTARKVADALNAVRDNGWLS